MGLARIVGIVLIVLGVLGLVFSGFSFTRETHEAQIGPLALSVAEKQTVSVPVWASVAVLVVGAGLVAVGGGKR